VITAELPAAQRQRWQPVRAGLVDIFLYDYEEFWFKDGHLLLRGNNGTGKSKVLALMLPFLLDGELGPSRVEPDGDAGKRMEWNLLLGGRYEERLGYSWLEFGRLADDGEPAYLTLGCGIKAVQGRGVAARWFFLASGRPGVDFWLIGERGAVLTRERLIEALQGRGRVFDAAEQYRHAVDERLFHLGPDRYAGLVNLLIQLRQPQLSKRPDEEKLSRALSQALRPVDQAILADIAQSFHDLESQREELRALQDTRTQVERFLVSYRHYASVAARRQSEEVRRAHSAFQETQRGLAAIKQELETAERDDAATARDQSATALELSRSRGRAAELRDRREVRELDAAEQLATLTSQQSVRAAALRTEADADVVERRSAWDQARSGAEESGRRVLAAAEQAGLAADAAGMGAGHREVMAALGPAAEVPTEDRVVQTAESVAARLSRDRAEAIAHMHGLVERAGEAARALQDSRLQLDELARELDAIREQGTAAGEAVLDATSALLDAWRGYGDTTVEVSISDLEGLLAGLGSWAETLDGEDPARSALATAARRAGNALSEKRAEALERLREVEAERLGLGSEQERLLRGEDTTPPQPYTRDPTARLLGPGAPLWQLIDFRDHVTPVQRAGLEAALEASGVLDAWLMPDGRLLDQGMHDEVVVIGGPAASNLGAALMVAVDRDHPQASAVADATVEAVLCGIGLGPATGDTWMDPSGRWRLGVTEGRWSKPAAAFIGRGARESARRRRLEELQAEIESVELAIAGAHAQTEAIEARQLALDRELSLSPSSEALRDIHLVAAEARRQLAACEVRVARQEALIVEREATASSSAEARDSAAADLELPADGVGLERGSQSVADYRAAVAGLWPEARAQADRLRAVQAAQAAFTRAGAVAAERVRESQRAAQAASDAGGRWEGLRDSIGATVEEIRAQLASLNARLAMLEAEVNRLNEQRLALQNRIGRAEGRQGELESALTQQNELRAHSMDALQRLAATGLLLVAVPDVDIPEAPWVPEPAVRLARRVEQALGAIESGDPAWERIQRDIGSRVKELQDALGSHGHNAMIDLIDGRFVVTITFQGQRRAPDELVALLLEEISHRDRLLDARERELLEEHLVNEVASHLQELISDAEAQVEQMNEELRRRPTSTGMRLRFRWAPRADGPAGLAEARGRLLRQVSDAWSPEDRGAVSAFLQQEIAAVRTSNESGTWLEQLTEAFDYRQWHRFVIERWQDGHWRLATDPASSGERVLTVTLPLFAAASAHYRSAHEHAPRLVMLDEAFAGVDDDSRAKCMGLLDTFDLDFVMTSEREWGCYPTVGGLAIHQLARREGIDAIHITRWEWDGRARTRVDPAIQAMRAPDGNRSALDAEHE